MATKAEKRAEKAELKQLSDAQKAEIKALKEAGATKAEIRAEKDSNKTELRTAKTTLSADGRQTLLTEGQPTYALTSSVGTYGDAAYAGDVQNRINNVVNTYETLGLQGVTSVSGTSQAGLNFNRVYDAVQTYDPATGRYTGTGPIARTLNTSQDVVGKSLTADQLDALGYKVTPVKGQEGLFQIKNKDDTITGVTFLSQNPDGSYTGLASTASTALNVPTGFFTTDLGKILAVGGAVALSLTPGGQAFAGQVGSVLSGGALTGAAATAAGQAVIRGLSTGLITGDVEKGLIAGAISGAGSALNLTGQMSSIFDSLGLSDYKDTFGVITPAAEGAGAVGGMLPSLGDGAFDIGGATGAGIIDQAGNIIPSLGQGAFDLYGATNAAGNVLPSLGDGAFDVAGAAGTGLLTPTTAAGVLGTGLTAREILSGLNTARQVSNVLGGGTGGATGGGGQAISDVLSGLFGGANIGQIAAPIIDYAQLSQIAREGQQFGQQMAQRAEQIGREAQTPFTPYTLTTGAGTATVAPGSATATAAAPYEALRQQALTQAGQTLGAINPAQATQQFYQNLEALASPTRQREQEQLMSRLGARGLLGIGRNLPTAGGGVAGVNPFVESLLSAQEQGRIQQALTAQQYGTSEAARQQALAQALQTQAMGIDTQTLNQLTQARQLGLDERSLAQANARLRAQSALAGLELRQPYDLLGLESRAAGITGIANIGRGMLGIPTQPGNRMASNAAGLGNVLNTIFSNLTSQGMTAEQAADYVNNISSGLDISGESQATQNLINEMQQYGIF